MIAPMRLKLFAISLALFCVSLTAPAAPPFVSPMFSDNMVLQRGKPNAFWGWAEPGKEVKVELAGAVATALAGADGRWQAELTPPAAGGPYTLRIEGPETVEFHEVLVGDVWLCGGQSNMELPLSRTTDGAQEIKSANHPEIRLFKVATHAAYAAGAIPKGRWKICSPETVADEGGFSAVAYYFARRVQQDTHAPIGLVEDCVGGTPAEAWTSPETLRGFKDFDAQLDEMARLHAEGGQEYGNYIMHWYDNFDVGQKQNWQAADFNDSSWKAVQIPGGFADLGVPDAPSVCWFRREITLPDPLPKGGATLHLGVVERMDTTYVNGRWVGASAWVENPRAYSVASDILKPGINVVAVRVLKTKPDGGFMSKPDVLDLVLGDKSTIPMAGEWKGALSVDARPPHPLPLGYENWPTMPGSLYFGMLQPVAPLAITGAIWYQGEGNTSHAKQYQTLLPAMIGDWRKLFGQGDFPFYIVSLPAFQHREDHPGDSGWAGLREAQAMTARNVPNCGLAVTVDTGDPDNIHPAEKKIVGERLAFCALAKHYGESIPCEGPTFKSMERQLGSLKLTFDHVDGGLVAKGGKLAEFSIAGKDRKWQWADARIEGDAVIVSSPDVPDPDAVRYAWQPNPEATLYNGAGLPAVPFRTDGE